MEKKIQNSVPEHMKGKIIKNKAKENSSKQMDKIDTLLCRGGIQMVLHFSSETMRPKWDILFKISRKKQEC
jgi:hypothetical protein